MSVQIMRDPSLTPPPANPQDAYLAYFGRYGVNERQATVTHHVQGSMRPSEIGTDYTRSVRLDGDRLVLGLDPARSLTWQRRGGEASGVSPLATGAVAGWLTCSRGSCWTT